MNQERDKIEIVNIWAVNDIKADQEIIHFLESLPMEHHSTGASALKEAYIVGFKKALQNCAGVINETCVKAEMSKIENLPVSKFYEIANSILNLGTQKV